MSATEFTLDLSALQRLTRLDVPAVAEKPMARFGRGWINELVEQRMNGRPGVNRRTGNLARDWNSLTVRDATGISLVIATHGTGDKYAGLQEYGGTVKPVHAQNLTIPLSANLTPAGVTRKTARQIIGAGGFFAKGLIFEKVGDKAVPMFVLKKSVTIPARLGAREKLAKDLPRLASAIEAEVKVAANG